MLNRRAFVRGAISAGLALPVVTEAQQSGNLPRVGYVQPDVPTAVLLRKVFLEGLRERGWSDGRNVAIDWRRRDEEIADLVRRPCGAEPILDRGRSETDDDHPDRHR